MKTAAIWWRVSTDDQKEISPDAQTSAALALAEQEGCLVPPEYIIGTDWASLSVWDKPADGEVQDGQERAEDPRTAGARALGYWK